MKVPLKPFTVEVKRSRSSSGAAKPTVSEPPVLIEAKPAPVQISVSQARQLAEQIFASLTSPSSPERGPLETAENVFRAPEPRDVEAVQADRTSGTKSPRILTPVQPAAESIKPRKTRTSKVAPPVAAPMKAPKSPKPRKSGKKLVQAAIKATPARPQVVALSLPQPVPALLVPASATAAYDPGWGPGERWKRRLRHLR